jgi:FKBP-type peptidyl-prolyl cis-trans isomerase 2
MTDSTIQAINRIEPEKTFVKLQYKVEIPGVRILKGAEAPEVMEFVTGYSHVIPGLEQRLIGHAQGEKLSFLVPAEEAFGERVQERVVEKDKSEFFFPEGFEPYIGMQLPIVTNYENGPESVRITDIRENTIVIDLNDPLAGHPLQYELEIMEVRPAKETDMCEQWDHPDNVSTGCGGIQQLVLGKEEEEEITH